MKLFKLEHDEHGIWYFTNLSKAAKYIGTCQSNIQRTLNGEFKQIKGWTVEEIEADDIICRYINSKNK